jgi:hypothetical protein
MDLTDNKTDIVSSQLESFKLDQEEEEDFVLAEVGANRFPVKTSGHCLNVEDKSVSVVVSK